MIMFFRAYCVSFYLEVYPVYADDPYSFQRSTPKIVAGVGQFFWKKRDQVDTCRE